MFVNKSEAHERVLNAVEDIRCCCEIGDDFHQWSDIAASSIQAFLEDLTNEQLDDTCGAFVEYIEETASENLNLAQGIREALTICLNEMIDYIGSVPDTDEDSETDDDDYYRETAYYAAAIHEALKTLKNMNMGGNKNE